MVLIFLSAKIHVSGIYSEGSFAKVDYLKESFWNSFAKTYFEKYWQGF